MATTTVSIKYQIVLPKEARMKTPFKPGAKVEVTALDADRIMITRAGGDRLKRMRGMGKELWRKAGGAEQYLKKERASWDD